MAFPREHGRAPLPSSRQPPWGKATLFPPVPFSKGKALGFLMEVTRFEAVIKLSIWESREKSRECVLSRPSCLINGELASRLRLSSTRPFRDRGDFASKNDSAVLLVNFLCGNLDDEYSFSINYYTLKTPKILEGLAPFIGSEISFRDFPSTAKKSVFGRRGGDGAMTKLKQL